MEQMELMNFDKAEFENGEDFTGFKVSDAVVKNLLKKKNIIKTEIQIQSTKTISPEELVSLDNLSIVNSNHVSKKKKSKSNVSSPETIDKHEQSVSKKFKSDGSQIISVKPLEINADQSLELTTPTFNLTSTPRSRRGFSRKVNVDITDPIFKLPFEHGWKRELVYRTTGDNASTNRTNRNGDVYYYSPNNRKFRSLREIQEQLNLNISDKNVLTIDSFTFLKQPIGIQDRSKEIIRDANTKILKEESFAGAAVSSKKSKTPVRPESENALSDNDINKSSNKMKIVFKNNKKRSRSKSNKDKSTSEPVNASSSTPEYVTEDLKAIQSSVTSIATTTKLDDVAQNNAANKIRGSEINGSLREMSDPMTCMQSFNYMLKAMRHVFMHLKIHELLSASRVCTAWNIIAMNKALWQTVRLKNATIHDWKKFVDTINDQGTVSLDTRRMLIPGNIKEYEAFWLRFCNDMKEATKLKSIELYRCPTQVVEDIIYLLPQLKVLNATSIKNPYLTKDVKNSNDLMSLSLKYLNSAINLTDLRIKGLSGIKLIDMSPVNNLTHLRTLSLTSIKSFPKDACQALGTLTKNLECLEIGDCDCLSNEFCVSLQRLTNLKSLRLENCCGEFDQFARDIFCVIRSLENLCVLELINIEFKETVEEELGKCYGIQSLLIIPAYISQSATTNSHLIDCLKNLSKTLTCLVWGLTHELLRVTDLFITQYEKNKHIGSNLKQKKTSDFTNNIPILKARRPKDMPEVDSTSDPDMTDNNVDILSISALEELLKNMMVCAKTKVIKMPFSSATRCYLTDHFKDL